MYEPPIRLLSTKTQTEIEDGVLRVVQRMGVDVDKYELLRALQYDRNQYNKGYEDGVRDTMDEVSRWIPVTERSPTKEDADKDGYVMVVYKTRFGDRFAAEAMYSAIKGNESRFTHWMPLPELPEDT